MRLVVTSDAYRLGIVNPVAARISDIEVVHPSPDIVVKDGTRAVEEAQRLFPSRIQKPEVVGFRQLFADMGYPGLEPAGERLVRTFMERGFKSINSLVDAYNTVAIEGVCGLGMHDISEYQGDIRVFRASGTEIMIPIFKEKPKKVCAGDLVYSVNDQIMAWLGRKDVDADAFKVTVHTREVILIALGNKDTSRSYNQEIIEECFRRLKFGAPRSTITILETVIEN